MIVSKPLLRRGFRFIGADYFVKDSGKDSASHRAAMRGYRFSQSFCQLGLIANNLINSVQRSIRGYN